MLLFFLIFYHFLFLLLFSFVSFRFLLGNTNQLTVNDQLNSPSSDDEVFQECENTFDLIENIPNTNIVAESGNRTVNLDSTLDATIQFPSNIANSTVAGPLLNGGGGNQINMSEALSGIQRSSLSDMTMINGSESSALVNGTSEYSNVLNQTLEGSQGSALVDDTVELKESFNGNSNEIVQQIINEDEKVNDGDVKIKESVEDVNLTIEVSNNVSENGVNGQIELNAALEQEQICATEVIDEKNLTLIVNDDASGNLDSSIVKRFNSSITVHKILDTTIDTVANGNVTTENTHIEQNTNIANQEDHVAEKGEKASESESHDNVQSVLNSTQEIKNIVDEILNRTTELGQNLNQTQDLFADNGVSTLSHNQTVNLNTTVEMTESNVIEGKETTLNDTQVLNQSVDKLESAAEPAAIPEDTHNETVNKDDEVCEPKERVLNETMSAIKDEPMETDEELPVNQVLTEKAISVLDVTVNVISNGEIATINPNSTFCTVPEFYTHVDPNSTFCTGLSSTNHVDPNGTFVTSENSKETVGPNTTFCASSNVKTHNLNETIDLPNGVSLNSAKLGMIYEAMDIDENALKTPAKTAKAPLNETIDLDNADNCSTNAKPLHIKEEYNISEPESVSIEQITNSSDKNSQFKVPKVPQITAPSASNFKLPQNQFTVSDDEFQSTGSKFLFCFYFWFYFFNFACVLFISLN